MNCPVCGKEMEKGHVITKNSIGLFFMPGEKDLRTFYTRRNIEADGGIVLDGPMTFRYNRTWLPAWVCRDLQEDRHGVLVGWKWTSGPMSVNNGTAVSRPSAGWTRREPGPWRGRCTPPPSSCPGRSDLPGLNDSKKLTAKKRDALFDADHRHGSGVQRRLCARRRRSTRLDILNARMLAMNRAIDGLIHSAGPVPHRRQPGPRQQRVHHGAPHVPGGRGREECLHRGGLHPGQGQPGPVCDRTCWTGSIPSTSLPNTRATGRSSTMKCWISTAPALPTGGLF